MSGSPSTVWSQLSSPYLAVGVIPFVGTDGLTIDVDPQNLWFDQVNYRLSVGTLGDQTGTDTINTYKQIDSFLPFTSITGPADSANTPGHTVSSARGTYASYLSTVAADFIGKFSGWGYSSGLATPGFAELAGMFVYAAAAGTANNLGGELHFFTRADAGALSDRVKIDNVGNILPSTAGTPGTGAQISASARLGKALVGFSALTLDYGLAAATGNITINKPVCQVQIAAGASSLVLTNSLITANSIVLATIATNDATLTFIKSCVAAAGQVTITGNANATATTKVNILVLCTDS